MRAMARQSRLRLVDDSLELARLVYVQTRTFPKGESYGLTSQMRRAVVSIGSNLAERSDRRSDADFARFVSISEGSAAELDFQLDLSKDLGYLNDDAHQSLSSKLRSLRRKMAALHRVLLRSASR